MELNKLLPDTVLRHEMRKIQVDGLTQDSRAVEIGDCYCAIDGDHFNGEAFIAQSIERGARVVFADALHAKDLSRTYPEAPIIGVVDLKHNLSAIAGRFYGHPSKQVPVFGVTGTNGKSSVVLLLASCLASFGQNTGVIGTLGVGFPGELKPTGFTTPDAIQTQKALRFLADEEADFIVMEVSSHALMQDRVADVQMPLVAFTNLSRDHLDYHADMQAYAAAKAKIFDLPFVRAAVINVDDAQGEAYAKHLPEEIDLVRYGITNADCQMSADDIQLGADGMRFKLKYEGRCLQVASPLLGRFNVMNLLTVAGMLAMIGVPFLHVASILSEQDAVPGRMQVLNPGVDQQPRVVVDFAHTPEALELVLEALRPLAEKKLICVFGCGGDRDRGKRPLMLRIAQRLSDQVIVTTDNPRTESVDQIIQDMLTGWEGDQANLQIIEDRKSAAETAISAAGVGDLVLLAGKGHETGQIIGTDSCPHSDIEIALTALVEDQLEK